MHQNTDPSRSEDRPAPSAGQKAQTQSGRDYCLEHTRRELDRACPPSGNVFSSFASPPPGVHELLRVAPMLTHKLPSSRPCADGQKRKRLTRPGQAVRRGASVGPARPVPPAKELAALGRDGRLHGRPGHLCPSPLRGKLPLSAPLTAGPAHGDGDVRAATPCSSRAPSVSAGSPRVVRVRLMAMNHPRAQQSVTSVTPACLLHPARCGNPGVTVSRSPVRGTGSGPGSSAEGNRCRELMTDVLITQSPKEGRRREPPPPPGGGPRRLRVLPNPRALQCGP